MLYSLLDWPLTNFWFWAQSAAMMGASAAAWRCWYCWCEVDTGQQRPAAWSTYKLVSASGFRNNFVWNLNIVSVKCPGCHSWAADFSRGSGFQILDFHFNMIGSGLSNEWERVFFIKALNVTQAIPRWPDDGNDNNNKSGVRCWFHINGVSGGWCSRAGEDMWPVRRCELGSGVRGLIKFMICWFSSRCQGCQYGI